MVEKKPGLLTRLGQALRLSESPYSASLPVPVSGIPSGARDVTTIESEQTITPMKPYEIGSTGTEVNAGYPAEEYLWSLRGRLRADVFDQMRRSDPQIVMCLNAVKNPLKGANWEVEPGHADGEEPTPEQIADADLIRHILFCDLDRPWKKVLSEILTVYDFGHSVFEVTHKAVLNHPRFGSYNGIASLGWRSPRTIERWNLNPKTGKLQSITQIAHGDLSRYVDIPATYLIAFSLNQEGSNYEGVSLLRPCYGAWKRKDLYMKLNAIGIEKFAVPTPLVKVPSGKADTAEFSKMDEALQKYVMHDANYLMYPDGWDLQLNNNTYNPQAVEESIDREDRRITKAFLANFLELGIGSSGGAYALSKDLSDFMLAGLEHVADEICGTINMDLIPNLIKMNKGSRDFYPKLKVSGISDKAGQELSNMLKTLGDGKWLTPEDGDEDHLRRRVGLPARTRKGERVVPAPSANPGAPAATLSERIRLAEEARLKGRRG